MRGIFRISLDSAAGFTAANLRLRAIILAAAFRSRTAILTGSILAATLALAMPVGATETGETHETASNFKARTDKICLKKTSYKTQGDAVPRYEYESSQIYDVKARLLEKIYDEISDDDRRKTKSAVKFDASGEREIGSAEYEWDFSAGKWRKVGLSRIERTKDGAFVYVSVYGQNGKLNQGQKIVEKRTGATEISQNFTLKNGKWTPTYLTKRLYDESYKTALIATFEWSAKAKKWTPYEKSIYHYSGDVYASSEGYKWRGKWVPQTKRAAFTAADGAHTEINFTWSEGAWQPEERVVQKTQPEFRRFTDLRCRWNAAKSEWRGCYKNVREETEQGRLKYSASSLWREESQRWEIVFENELSYDARGKVIKNRETSEDERREYVYGYDEAGNNISVTLREPDESGKWHETQRTQNVFERGILAHDVLDRGFIGDYIAAGENTIKSSKQYFLKDGEFKLNETREWFYGKCEPQ